LEVGLRVGVRVMWATRRCPYPLLGKVNPEPAVEGDGCREVAAYNVDLVQSRCPVHGALPSRDTRSSMSTTLLEGERALVTGCAGGIGRGIARALKQEGATVLGSDIVRPPAEDGIEFLAADLAERTGWKILLEGAIPRLGTISLLVHAASPRRHEVDTPLSVDEATWDAMSDINLRSGFFLAREAG